MPGRARLAGSASPPQTTASEFCSYQKEMYCSHARCSMTFLTGGKGPGGQGMSPALSILNRECWFHMRCTSWPSGKFIMLWGSRGPLGHDFDREIKLFNFSVSSSKKLLKENYQIYISLNCSSLCFYFSHVFCKLYSIFIALCYFKSAFWVPKSPETQKSSLWWIKESK